MHFHKWDRWQTGEATYDSPLFPKLGEWTVPIQYRHCTKCGKLKVKKVNA